MRHLDEWVSFGLIVLIFIFAGMNFSFPGISDISLMAFAAVAGFSFLGWRVYRKKYSSEIVKRRLRFFLGSGVILLLLSGYCLNPTHEWKEGVGALPVDSISFLPGAAFVPGALRTLSFSALLLSVLGLSMSFSHCAAERLRFVILFAGALTGLVVLGQRLAPVQFPVFETTGFFPYENHFAAFANLIFPVALFSAAREKVRAFQEGSVSSPAGPLILVSVILLASILVSGSRAGIALSGMSISIFLLWLIFLYRRNPFAVPPITPTVKICGCIAGVLIAVLFFYAVAGNGAGLSCLEKEFSFRQQVSCDTWSMWKEHMVWGTGPGSFSAVFPYYQDETALPPEKYFFSHAHCDPLEFLSEYGLLGSLIMLAAFFRLLTAGFGRWVREVSSPFFLSFDRMGLGLALITVVLHSLVDFPFHHPSIVLLAAVWLGILIPRLYLRKKKIKE